MTFELYLYGMTVFIAAIALLLAACCAFIRGQIKTLEIKPEQKSEMVIRIVKEEAERVKKEPVEDREQQQRQRTKQLMEKEIADQDKAVEEFIARGGLPR